MRIRKNHPSKSAFRKRKTGGVMKDGHGKKKRSLFTVGERPGGAYNPRYLVI